MFALAALITALPLTLLRNECVIASDGSDGAATLHAFPADYSHSPIEDSWVVDAQVEGGLHEAGLCLRRTDTTRAWILRLVGFGSQGDAHVEGASVDETGMAPGYAVRRWGPGIDEWCAATPTGLQHGFTVWNDALADQGHVLELELRSTPEFLAIANKDADGVLFLHSSGRWGVRYWGLTAWDADARQLRARLHANRDSIRILVDTSAARFPITIDPWVEQVVITNPSFITTSLGVEVAISGNTLVAAAIGDDSACSGVNCNPASTGLLGSAGAVLVHVRTPLGWQRQAYLKASNPDSGDAFGWSVAISGDTIVVGVPYEASGASGVNGNQLDNSAPDTGAAYVFSRQGSVWSQQAYLKASNAQIGDSFGWSVDVHGDLIVVGSPGEDGSSSGVNGNQLSNGLANSGAAYVFVRNGTTWTQEAYLKASNTGMADHFGEAVAAHDDIVVVGAQREDSAAVGVNGNGLDDSVSDSGAAYVFARSAGVWTGPDYLKPDNPGQFKNFGRSVDVDHDTIVIGHPIDDGQRGSAVVFVRSLSTWAQQARLTPSLPAFSAMFGNSVAIDADRIVVGAPFQSTVLPDDGAVHVFERQGVQWSFARLLTSTQPQVHAQFGWDLDLSEDTVAVWSPQEMQPWPTAQGSVRVIELDTKGETICSGDGSATACPCGNVGATAGAGCASSVGSSGARLSSSGVASYWADSLLLTADGMSGGAGILLQGTASQALDQGVVLGDGLLCTAGTVLRLAVLFPQSGSVQIPTSAPLETPISVLGLVQSGGTRVYQIWFRDAANFCTPETFNLTNGLRLRWRP